MKVARHKLPHPSLQSLNYNGADWCLLYRDGNQKRYKQIKIRLDAGFLFIVAFRNRLKFTNIVIFNDQLLPEIRKIIYVLEKVANKPR